MESLKKCMVCNGTGDKMRRANVNPALRQQCSNCRGEGMELDISRWEEILKEEGGLSLRVDQPRIDATPMNEADPDWKYTDGKRHVHRWRLQDGDPGTAVCTTLKYVIDIEATGDVPEEGHLECNRCGERVEPGYRDLQEAAPRTMAGLTTYMVNDEEVGPRTFWAVANLIRQGG